VKLLARISAFFVRNVVRQRTGYRYFENAGTSQARRDWGGNVWGHMRSGHVSYGPFGRQVCG
jgi:hypothetical protein